MEPFARMVPWIQGIRLNGGGGGYEYIKSSCFGGWIFNAWANGSRAGSNRPNRRLCGCEGIYKREIQYRTGGLLVGLIVKTGG